MFLVTSLGYFINGNNLWLLD